MMGSRQLEYFRAVARELHFTRAAEALQIAQPALSQQIRKLERQLGIALFERNNHRVRLTPAGAALLEHAENVRRRAEGVVTQGLPSRGRSAHRWRHIGASAIDASLLAGVNASMLLLSARLTNAGVEDVWREARWPLVGSWGLTTALYFIVSRSLTGRSTGAAVVGWLARMLEHRLEQSGARRHAG